MYASVESSMDNGSHSVKQEEIDFMNRALEAWARWAWTKSVKLGYPQAGDIWGLKKPATPKLRELDLRDDQCQQIDKAIAKLPWRDGRRLIFIEYFLDEPEEAKGKRCKPALSRWSWRRKMDKLRYELYQKLMPDIESWRL